MNRRRAAVAALAVGAVVFLGACSGGGGSPKGFTQRVSGEDGISGSVDMDHPKVPKDFPSLEVPLPTEGRLQAVVTGTQKPNHFYTFTYSLAGQNGRAVGADYQPCAREGELHDQELQLDRWERRWLHHLRRDEPEVGRHRRLGQGLTARAFGDLGPGHDARHAERRPPASSTCSTTARIRSSIPTTRTRRRPPRRSRSTAASEPASVADLPEAQALGRCGSGGGDPVPLAEDPHHVTGPALADADVDHRARRATAPSASRTRWPARRSGGSRRPARSSGTRTPAGRG